MGDKISQWRVLARLLTWYGLAQVGAIMVARSLRQGVIVPAGTLTAQVNLGEFLVYFFVATAALMLLMRLFHWSWLYRVILLVVIALGTATTFEATFPLPLGLTMSFLSVLAYLLVPTVSMHNLLVVLTATGLGPVLGLQFTPPFAAAILVILSVYDFFAVYVSKHMVKMATDMLSAGSLFGFIIPINKNDYQAKLQLVKPGAGFMIMGGGDIVLPMLLSVSVDVGSQTGAWWVVAGSMVGVVLNHLVITKWQKPIPALPLITVCAVFGWWIGSMLY